MEEAPVVADASPLHTYATMAATSSGVANRLMSEDGRTVWKNSRSTVAASTPRARPMSATKVATPSEAVGPGRTLLTVTPVPETDSASPRARATCAVLVVP